MYQRNSQSNFYLKLSLAQAVSPDQGLPATFLRLILNGRKGLSAET
jgi:hypothetical protein